ncbi:MAG: DUF2680 domain-containing protein [Desulfurispora sp.]|uniref:DUF2680 domain-containing protein n=1 Tax=Desulfurispora sp. TaxID=3014275 RepID=UPI00404AEB1D
MKRAWGVVVLLALVAALAIPAFAADTTSSAEAWFKQMFNTKKAYVDQAVKDGRLSKEQGEALKQHFDQMYQWHAQNGFVCPMAGTRAGGLGMGRGMGMGWRGGGFWQNQAPAANSVQQ